jgi:hypothetical protein
VAVDAWTREIFEAFVKVLRRPRYNLKVGEISSWNNFYEKGFTVNISTSWGEILKLNIQSDKNSATISCYDNSDGTFEFTGFHYSITIYRRAPTKIRKAAITFVTKVLQKPVYDVIKG